MSLEITIGFGEGKRVNATIGDMEIRTDQSVKAGGDGSAPEPFSLFLASIGTCAGIYVLGFCQSRDIPTDGIRIVERASWSGTPPRLSKIEIEIGLPEAFPEKYRKAVVRAADLCAVKRVILDPPEFEVHAVSTSG